MLAEQLGDLASRTVTALDASHDYYTYTKRWWNLLSQIVKTRQIFSFRNPSTGIRVDQIALRDRADEYVKDYLTPFSFQRFVSIFEDFFVALLRLWLVAHPESLSRKQVDFG